MSLWKNTYAPGFGGDSPCKPEGGGITHRCFYWSLLRSDSTLILSLDIFLAKALCSGLALKSALCLVHMPAAPNGPSLEIKEEVNHAPRHLSWGKVSFSRFWIQMIWLAHSQAKVPTPLLRVYLDVIHIHHCLTLRCRYKVLI